MPQFETKTQTKGHVVQQQQRSYQEVITYLDQHWKISKPTTIKKLDSLLGNLSTKLSTIIISGTNGKSTTINYLTKLLAAEGLQIGTFSSPHFAYYNERFTINNQLISNETFTELANIIINLAEEHSINVTSRDILTAMALLYFDKQQVDITIFELENVNNFDPITICSPQVLGITRVIPQEDLTTDLTIDKILKLVQPNTYVVSADQSKLSLQVMAQKTMDKKGNWIMPIRKLAPLPYPYEQLHGRCAALAERIAQTYIEHIFDKNSTQITDSLLSTPKKQRGRPRLSSKQHTNPQNGLTEFWKNIDTNITSRFQVITYQKKTILLDTANNLDALDNLFLGVRLLHYKKSFKNIAFIFGCFDQQINETEFIKTLRYFLKKTPGTLAFCPISNNIGEQTGTNWNAEKMATFAQSSKLKATAYKNLKSAYTATLKYFDEEQDLLVITGSQAIVSEFFKIKE